jgi:hypothetical protein
MDPAAAACVLAQFQRWRRGEDERPLEETGLTPARIGDAIDAALARLRVLEAENRRLAGLYQKSITDRARIHSQLRRLTAAAPAEDPEAPADPTTAPPPPPAAAAGSVSQ